MCSVPLHEFFVNRTAPRYFKAYLDFFKAELDLKPVAALLEEYVFDTCANFPGNEKHPEMLNCFLQGLLHSQIHTGFGIEFGLPSHPSPLVPYTMGRRMVTVSHQLWKGGVRGLWLQGPINYGSADCLCKVPQTVGERTALNPTFCGCADYCI